MPSYNWNIIDNTCKMPSYNWNSIDNTCKMPSYNWNTIDNTCKMPSYNWNIIDNTCKMPSYNWYTIDNRCRMPSYNWNTIDNTCKMPFNQTTDIRVKNDNFDIQYCYFPSNSQNNNNNFLYYCTSIDIWIATRDLSGRKTLSSTILSLSFLNIDLIKIITVDRFTLYVQLYRHHPLCHHHIDLHPEPKLHPPLLSIVVLF